MRSSAWLAVPALIVLSLTGCVQQTFAPEPGTSIPTYEADAANCRIFARSNAPDFAVSASGSAKSAAVATLAAAVVGGITSAIVITVA